MQGSNCPQIAKLSWGEVRVADQKFKDAKIFPGGAREWDWRETGTHHKPGIQIADVKEAIDAGAKVVILSTGIWQYLRVRPETLEYLESAGITTHVLQTEEAVALYNKLRETEPVAILVHSTC